MKRNSDLIRRILLHVEENIQPGDNDSISLEDFPDVNWNVFVEHIRLLSDSGFIDLHKNWEFGESVFVRGLSMKGFDLLDSIRDPKIWSKTKNTVDKVGGVALDVLMQVAKGYVVQMLEKTTGFQL